MHGICNVIVHYTMNSISTLAYKSMQLFDNAHDASRTHFDVNEGKKRDRM